jgi:hypothetical protein
VHEHNKILWVVLLWFGCDLGESPEVHMLKQAVPMQGVAVRRCWDIEGVKPSERSLGHWSCCPWNMLMQFSATLVSSQERTCYKRMSPIHPLLWLHLTMWSFPPHMFPPWCHLPQPWWPSIELARWCFVVQNCELNQPPFFIYYLAWGILS